MKKQKWIRKGLAMLLTAAMVVGMMSGIIPGKVAVVQAASTTPSVTAYATKTQLMNDFTPNEDGTATNIGRLSFGRNSYSVTQIWYILGKDEGIKENGSVIDNTTIFAVAPIVTGQQFYHTTPTSPGQGAVFGPNSVYASFYGTSMLREKMNSIAGNSTYFSSDEQKLMNVTTVTTHDSFGQGKDYTTSDKLYAASTESTFYSIAIRVGSGDQIILPMNRYCSAGADFWLRTEDSYSTAAYGACSYSYVSLKEIGEQCGVRPATNLNLSSVLFASAAKVSSSGVSKGTISKDAAMTLRLDGSGMNIGTVAYNATKGTIKAIKGSGTGTTALVVQGNDGTNDWYYSKTISGTETLTTSTIQSACNLSSAPDLSKCKIWMETTNNRVTYAVNAKVAPSYTIPTMTAKEITYNKTLNNVYTSTGLASLLGSPKANGTVISGTWSWVDGSSTKVGNLGEKTFQAKFSPNSTALSQYIWDDVPGWDASGKYIKVDVPVKVVENQISSVAITGITAPVANTTLDTTASCSTTGVSSTSPSVSWSPTPNGEKAGFNIIYTASVTLNPVYGYKFTTTPTATVNSNTATSVKKNADGTLTVTKSFSATAKKKITELTVPTVPANKTFSNYYTESTVLSASELGKAVATFEAPEVSPATADMDVTWTLENYDDEPYDPTPGAKNIFRWTVKSIEYTNYDVTSNNIVLTGKVSIRNKAATSVSVTGTDASVSYNGADIDVSQYFTYGSNVGAVTYSLVPKSEDATVTGEGELTQSTLKIKKAGVFKVKLSIEAQGNYAIAEKTITLTVEKGILSNTPQSTMNVLYINKSVGDVALPDNWSWQVSDETKVLEVGTAVTAAAVYIGEGKGNYITESVEITITRQACTHNGETETKNAKEATCTESGCTGDIYCKICQKKIKDTKEIDALGHDMTKVISDKVDATCTSDGKEAIMGCSRCDHTEGGGEIKALEHTYVNGVCSGCDKIWEAVVDGITYQVITIVGENGKPVGQTVTVAGNDVLQVAVTVVKADVKDTNKVIIPSEITGSGSEQNFVVTKVGANAFEETAVTEIVVPDTVTEVGSGAFGGATTITFNGSTVPDGITEADLQAVTTVKVPEGAKDSYQAVLGDSVNIEEEHTHKYADTWTYNETGHWKKTTCGHDSEEGVLDVQPHTFGDWTELKKATVIAEGLKERSCACGYKETAKIEKLAHTHVTGEGIRLEPTCEGKGSITYKCTQCGQVMKVTELAAIGHKWDTGKVTKEPTETAEGVKTHTCTVCKKTKTVVIPKKEATTPQPPKEEAATPQPPKKGDIVADDKASAIVELTDVKKKGVAYKAHANKKAKTVTIPATVKINGVTYKVTKIADNAFKNNKTVTKVTVGSNIKIIGKQAFSGCKKLKTIKINSTKLTSKTVSKNAFKGLTKVTTIKVPKKKLSAYKKLFKQKGLSSKVKVKGY